MWPTLITLASLGVLIALGTWQLDRRAWKHDLIERVEARAGAAPVALPPPSSWPTLTADDWAYRPVVTRGVFDHDAETYVFTSLSDASGPWSGPGYWIVTPLRLDSGGIVLVNRGFVPERHLAPETRPEGRVEGRRRIEGLMRFTETPGRFTPEPDEDARIWYVRDIAAIAASLGLDDAAPFVIDATASAPGGLPQGGETRLTFVDNHLSYALTWYGLAAVLVVIYLAYRRAHGRQRPPQND